MYKRRRSQSGDALYDWYFTVQQTILAYQVTFIVFTLNAGFKLPRPVCAACIIIYTYYGRSNVDLV